MASTTCTCGAMLPEPDMVGLVTCPSCGRVTRVSPDAAGSSTGQASSKAGSAAWPAPPVIAPDPGSGTAWKPPAAGAGATLRDVPGMETVQTVTKFGKGCAVVVTLVVVVAIVGAVLLVVSKAKDVIESTSRLSDDITLSGSVGVLGTTPGGEPSDLTAVVQHYDNGTHRYLARLTLDRTGFSERWRSPELPEDAYDAQVAVVGDTLFAGFKDQLWALSAGTGKQRWQTTLPDAVTTSCESCFEAVEGTLVIRTNDAYLRAYRPTSGEPMWSRRLNATSAEPSVTGGHLYVVDDSPERGQPARVHTIDPSTGRDRRSISPACPGDQLHSGVAIDAGAPVYAVAGTRDLVSLFGFGSACVARWDAVTNQVRYAARLPDSASVTDPEDAVVGPRDMVAPTGTGLVRIDLGSGRSVAMEPGLDQRIEPGPIVGRVELAPTTTTRGTTRGGLAGYSLDTGRRLWSVPAPRGAQPASGDSTDALFTGQARYTLMVDGETVRMVVFSGEPPTATTFTVALGTGDLDEGATVTVPRRYDSGTPSIGTEAVGRTWLVFTVDNLLEVLYAHEARIATYPD